MMQLQLKRYSSGKSRKKRRKGIPNLNLEQLSVENWRRRVEWRGILKEAQYGVRLVRPVE